MALKFHFNFIPIVVSEASTKEYQEYLPAEVLEAGIKAVKRERFSNGRVTINNDD